MSTANLTKYIDERVEKKLPMLSLSQIEAITDYDRWLDPPARTPDTADLGQTCPRCEGTGKYQRLGFPANDCALCNGSGHV